MEEPRNSHLGLQRELARPPNLAISGVAGNPSWRSAASGVGDLRPCGQAFLATHLFVLASGAKVWHVASMQTDDVLTLLKETAAEVITPRFRSLKAGEIAEKSPGDLVTVADQEAEILIARAISAAYPEALIVGEEAASADPSILEKFGSAEHSWTIDPVDGTKNFVHGSPDFAVMVAQLRNNKPVRAWLWQPVNEVAHVAELGAGVWRNGERVARRDDDAAVEEASARLRSSYTTGSAGVDYAQLADDEIDYVLFRRDLPWDHVPGVLLTEEVGGQTGRLDGSPYQPAVREPWILAARSPSAFEALRRELRAEVAAGLRGSRSGIRA